MRQNIRQKLAADSDYYLFLRQYPHWYRELTRYPEKLDDFLEEYKVERKKTFGDKMERGGNVVSLARAFLDM